jgi:hypothetical protein
MPSPLGLSTWNDFPGPFSGRSGATPYIRVHLARAGDGVVVDEDSGARYILGPPDGLDQAFMQATGACPMTRARPALPPGSAAG